MPEVFVTAEQVKHGKPAPDAYLLGAERLGLPAGECAVVEDAPAGSSPDWRPAVALSRSTCPPMPLARMKPTSC